MNSPQPRAYSGTPTQPYPPCGDGWVEAHPQDLVARRLSDALCGWLPAWHYADTLTPTGLYRFFAFQTAVGFHVGALRFEGKTSGCGCGCGGDGGGCAKAAGTMGAPEGSSTSQDNFAANSAGEPIPQANATCSAYTPTTANSNMNALANNISYNTGNPPVAWAANTYYDTTDSGNTYRLVMWSPDGTQRNVSVFQCTPVLSPPTCPSGQVNDSVTGQCVAPCPNGSAPANGMCSGSPPSNNASASSGGLVALVLAALGLGLGGFFGHSKGWF